MLGGFLLSLVEFKNVLIGLRVLAIRLATRAGFRVTLNSAGWT